MSRFRLKVCLVLETLEGFVDPGGSFRPTAPTDGIMLADRWMSDLQMTPSEIGKIGEWERTHRIETVLWFWLEVASNKWTRSGLRPDPGGSEHGYHWTSAFLDLRDKEE
jgi:hypothetical protein